MPRIFRNEVTTDVGQSLVDRQAASCLTAAVATASCALRRAVSRQVVGCAVAALGTLKCLALASLAIGRVLLSGGIVMLLLGCQRGHVAGPKANSGASQEKPVAQAVLQTALHQVQRVKWPTVVRAQGSLAADEVSQIGATVPGRVAVVHVDLGDSVNVDTPLVSLDQEEFQLQVAQVEAQLHEARAAVGLPPDVPVEQLDPAQAPIVREAKTVWEEARLRLKRAQALRDSMAISLEEYEQAVAAEQVAAARYASSLNNANERIAQIRVRAAELAVAKRRLVEAVTRAPFRGFVQQRHVAPGMYVQVGQPLVTLVRADRLRFRGTLPERYTQHLQVGRTVRIFVEGASEPLTSQISRISPAVDEWNRAILFEAIVDNENAQFRSGLFAVAEVEIDPDATALVVPQSAVWQFAGTEKVWRVDAGQARQRLVLTGRRRDNWLEILEGLSEGDWVVQDASVGRAGPVAPPGAMQASAEVTPNTLPIQSPQHGPEPEEKTPAANTGG